ncbi:MAG: transposase [Chloroflexi bacterium]|nr:transposase [Chloroflexota bacterium]
MQTHRYFVGLDVDIAAKKVAATIGIAPWKVLAGPATFPDSLEGFQQLLTWLHSYHCLPDETVFCMEPTGSYGEPLTYFLAAQGYSIAIEPLVKVRRTFPEQKRNGFELKSQHIAKYAYRSASALRLWEPSTEMLEQVKTILADSRSARVDEQMRDLLEPQPCIAHDWPCY